MVYALIFASGIGSRMGFETPKQFIQINNKPILVYTLEVFNKAPVIDKILIVTLSEYISVVKKYISEYNLTKVMDVISGGKTAMESQFIGLNYLKVISKAKDLIYIHDGVRPFIDENTINQCHNTALAHGNAITISPATETVSLLDNNNQIERIIPRQKCIIARAPQVFLLNDIFDAHIKVGDGRNKFVDSASLMMNQNIKLNIVEGPAENIKITTQYDLILCELWMNKNEKE